MDNIVYLTPDSNEPLNNIDEDTVYVIGGWKCNKSKILHSHMGPVFGVTVYDKLWSNAACSFAKMS